MQTAVNQRCSCQRQQPKGSTKRKPFAKKSRRPVWESPAHTFDTITRFVHHEALELEKRASLPTNGSNKAQSATQRRRGFLQGETSKQQQQNLLPFFRNSRTPELKKKRHVHCTNSCISQPGDNLQPGHTLLQMLHAACSPKTAAPHIVTAACQYKRAQYCARKRHEGKRGVCDGAVRKVEVSECRHEGKAAKQNLMRMCHESTFTNITRVSIRPVLTLPSSSVLPASSRCDRTCEEML